VLPSEKTSWDGAAMETVDGFRYQKTAIYNRSLTVPPPPCVGAPH